MFGILSEKATKGVKLMVDEGGSDDDDDDDATPAVFRELIKNECLSYMCK